MGELELGQTALGQILVVELVFKHRPHRKPIMVPLHLRLLVKIRHQVAATCTRSLMHLGQSRI